MFNELGRVAGENHALSGKARSAPPSLVVLLGMVIAAAATAAYSLELSGLAVSTPGEVSSLVPIGEAYWAVLIAGVAIVLYGTKEAIAERIVRIRDDGQAPLAPGWIIPYVLSLKRYRRYLVGSTLVYAVIYAIITSMVVYQPTVDFVSGYGVQVPSAHLTPVFGAPLFSPVIVVYVVNHLGLFLMPLTVLLLVATSILVGLNIALAAFAFGSRAGGAGRGWLSGMGAVVGLFTGCPTCAGLFFANFLGGAGAVSFVTLLGYYQPVFILLSIPTLLAAPYLVSRGLAKIYRDGCVLVRKSD